MDFSGYPRFYFTVHHGDLMRERLLPRSYVMVVASAYWDNNRGRFRISRPPADVIAGVSIDSGGFTAAKRWGRYPWSFRQYIDFIEEMSRDVNLTFCAIMDYACEPGVNRSKYNANLERIRVTIDNEIRLRESAPGLPWLPVLQGDTLEERAEDLRLRFSLNLVPGAYAGIGSMCGRGIEGAQRAVKFYVDRLPGVRYHGFGMHVAALDDDVVYSAIRSWDSYGWNWGRGKTEMRKPKEYFQRDGESYSQYTRRLAGLYWQNTISPRLEKQRQSTLW